MAKWKPIAVGCGVNGRWRRWEWKYAPAVPRCWAMVAGASESPVGRWEVQTLGLNPTFPDLVSLGWVSRIHSSKKPGLRTLKSIKSMKGKIFPVSFTIVPPGARSVSAHKSFSVTMQNSSSITELLASTTSKGYKLGWTIWNDHFLWVTSSQIEAVSCSLISYQ